MALNDIKNIKKSIRTHLEDLHIIISEDGVSIDTQLYNDVTLALLGAESSIDFAIMCHEDRVKQHKEKYGEPNTNVD